MSQFPMNQRAGTEGYSPISFYDKPSVLLEQLLDGDASFASVRDTLFNSDKLTPRERDSLADHLREALGVEQGPSLANGLIEAATNPLTWMVLLTTPPGARALKTGGALVKNVGTKGLFPFLQAMRTTTAMRGADQIGASELAWETNRRLRDVGEERGVWYQGFQQKVKKALGTEHIDEMTPQKRQLEGYAMARKGGMITGEPDRVLKVRQMVIEKDGEGFKPAGLVDTEPSHGEFVKWGDKWIDLIANTTAYDTAEIAVTKWERTLSKLKDDLREAKTEAERRGWRKEIASHTRAKPEGPMTAFYRPEAGSEKAALEMKKPFQLTDEEKAKLEAWGQQNGHVDKEILSTLNEEQQRRYARDFLDEKGMPDMGKLQRHMAGGASEQLDPAERNRLAKLAIRYGVEGEEAMRLMTSDPVMRAGRAGAWDKKQYDAVMQDVLKSVEPHNYLPMIKTEAVKLTDIEKRGRNLAGPGERERMTKLEEDVMPRGSGSFIGRQSYEKPWHDEDINNLASILGEDSPSIVSLRADHAAAREKMLEEGMIPTFVRRSPLASLPAYLHHSDIGFVMDVEGAGEFAKKRWYEWRAKRGSNKGKAHRGDDWTGKTPTLDEPLDAISGGASRRDFWKQVLAHEAGSGDDKVVREQMRTMFKVASGEESHTLGLHTAAFATSRGYMRTFAESGVGKWLEKNGGEAGKDFVSGLKKISEEGFEGSGDKFGNTLARYFYATHLGLNLGSVAMNLTQPFLFVAPHLGARATLEGLKDTITAFHGYAKERMALGVRANPAERIKAMEKWFPHAKELGIGDDAIRQLDEQILGGRTYRDGKLSRIEGALLKPFEVSERWNRVLTGNIVKASYKQNGLKAEGDGFLYDLHRIVSETQYGSSAENTPALFQKGLMSWAPLRQFMAFPLRTAGAALDVFPNLTNPDSYTRGLLMSTMRAVGASALTYEVLKGTLGADVSRGLYASSVTDLVGGERFGEKGNDWISLPPVISVPKDMIAAISQDDHDAYAQALGRLLPAGVAFSRGLGIAPKFGEFRGLPDPSDMQKTYVGWDTPDPNTGMLPVFNSTGRLVEFKSKLEIYQRGLGLDAGKWGDVGKFDNYMVTQRAQILDYKGRYLTAMSNSNFTLANSISNEFYKRYKVKLSVGQDQLRSFQEGRTRARSERILDRVSPDLREQFMGMMASTPGVNTGLTREQLFSAMTAKGRDRSYQGVTPEQMEELQRRIEAVGRAGAQGGSSPFGEF